MRHAPRGAAAANHHAGIDLRATVAMAPPSVGRQVGLFAALWWTSIARPRQLASLALLALAIAGVAYATARAQPDLSGAVLDGLVGLGLPTLGLLGVALGGRALRVDAESGALDLWLLRPRAAVALPLGRVLATSAQAAAFGLCLVALGAVADGLLGRLWDPARAAALLLSCAVGALGYCALGMFAATLGRAGPALALGWWLAFDLGLSRLSSSLEALALRPSLVAIATFDPDLSLLALDGDGRLFWAALARVLVVAGLALGATLWRLRGDVPD